MLARKEPGIKAAVAGIREFTEDERMREEYLLREKIERDRREELRTAYLEGEERVSKLYRILVKRKQYDELQRASMDSRYRDDLMEKYGIE